MIIMKLCIIILMMFVDVINIRPYDQPDGTSWVILTNSQDTIPILTFGFVSGNILQLNTGTVDTNVDINTVDRIVHV